MRYRGPEGLYTSAMRVSPRIAVLICSLLAAGVAMWLLAGVLRDPVPEVPPERTARDDIRDALWEEDQRTPIRDTGAVLPESEFFRKNSSLPLAISHADFQRELEAGKTFVLDAREPEERAIGRLPGSGHIRFGDLREGGWRDLPRDTVVTVVCYSGVRGELVARFLRSRGIVARYIEQGAVEWVADGGSWEGEIDFYGHYDDPRFRTFLPPEALCHRDAVLVDARPAYKFDERHLPGAKRVLIGYATTPEADRMLSAIPARRPVILVCDEYSSCFDATIAALRLQVRGHPFIGLYQDVGPAPACLR